MKKGAAYLPFFTVVVIFFKLLVLVACSLTDQQIFHAASFRYAINIPDTLMIKTMNLTLLFRFFRFVATPFVESNVQAIKVKQVQDELKEMETNAVDLNTSKGTPVERESCTSPFI